MYSTCVEKKSIFLYLNNPRTQRSPKSEAVLAIRLGRPWPTQTRAWPTQTKFCPTYTTPIGLPRICLAL